MNIFEFLGLPANHRADNKVVQLVKHFDDVNKRAEEGIFHKKVSFPMYAQVKKDGVFCALVISEERGVAMFNRTGKRLTNVERLEGYYTYLLTDGQVDAGVYFGELCNNRLSLEELSGCVNPNRVNPLTPEQAVAMLLSEIYFFDEVTVQEFIGGKSSRTYEDRFYSLVVEMCEHSDILPLHTVNNYEELKAFAELQIEQGEEGAVFKQDVEWLAGAKDWHQMKIVRGVSYDLICTGYEEGAGKYTGLVANLLFKLDDKRTVKAMLGKGWTHEDAREMFLNITYPESIGMQGYTHKDSPVGKMFEVYGLQPSSKNGLIRLPKVGELRHDKTEPDII